MTEEEWASWKEHPTTKLFREFLRKELKEATENWLGGKFTSPDGDQTLQLNSRAIGSCQVYKNILEMTAEDINTGMSDE